MDRLAGRGGTTISKKMAREPVRGEHEVEVRDDHGQVSTARLGLRFCRMTVHPPVGKQGRYPALSLTVIHAHERGAPAGRDPIRWNLLTDLPVDGLPSAIEKLDWYSLRWKAETYHKVLKSGCQAEQARLRTADRLTNLLAVLCVVGWRVFWLTMASRATPDAPPEVAFTPAEIAVLDRAAGGPPQAAEADDLPLPAGGGEAGRLPGPHEGPAARQHGRLARAHPARRHPPRLRTAQPSCG